ncbi:succinate dehydrogenase [Cognatiyoonia sp. IB215182]|uniref:succinate dehydrogenase n=1 Tax=Cognatiyoonia sp. IB215182 TaxID=3097353 RepID=UPI002A10744B|nr:succinate dehydrogenase [Cognatiyoonia sp. IB215182]MDX8351759.1 succinate dehydrogenase [Cognatiyoonia sp. IB215182]
MRILAVSGIALALAGCMQDLGPAGDTLARDAAKGVVNSVVQTRFPGVNAEPYTDCIIDNASGSEILQIAEAAIVGTTQATTELVADIAARPETVRCAVNNSLAIPGLTL